MKKFTSFGGGSGSRKKEAAANAGEQRAQGRENAGSELDSSTMNELEMLRAENAHLKRLIEQQQEAQVVGGEDPARDAEVAHLRRERDELQRQLANLQSDYEALQRDYANLQRDRRLEVNEHHSETRTVEAQIEFMSQQHKHELEEKESRIRDLEMKLVDLEQEVELAQSPTHFIHVRSLDMDEMKERIADLEKRLQVANADNRRRAEEADRLREELEEAKLKGGDEGLLASVNAEKDYFKAQVAEHEAKAQNYHDKATDLEAQAQSLSEELHRKQEIIGRLESQLADLRMRHSPGRAEAHEGGGGEAPLPQDVKELQQLLREKEKAVWDLSDRLLATSSEKDNVEQENRQLKIQLEAAQASSSQPLTPSGKKSKSKGGGVSDEVYRQLQTQLAAVQTQLATATAEKDESERRRKVHAVEMEQKLEGADRSLRRLAEDKDRLECALKKKDAEIAALEVSQDYRSQALAVARGVALPPLPKTQPAGGSEEGTGAHATNDLEIELALKSAALRALSVKNAHLHDVLQRLQHTTSMEATEKELQRTKATLQDVHSQLCQAKGDLQKQKAEKTQLETRVSRLEAELEVSRQDDRVAREALAEAQKRNARTAEEYKAQNEKYSSLLARAMADVERMEAELTKERSARREAGKTFREQLRRLRASKARRLDFATADPLQPLPSSKDLLTSPSGANRDNSFSSSVSRSLRGPSTTQEAAEPQGGQPLTFPIGKDECERPRGRNAFDTDAHFFQRERLANQLASAPESKTTAGDRDGRGSTRIGVSTPHADLSGACTAWRRETQQLPRPVGDDGLFLSSPASSSFLSPAAHPEEEALHKAQLSHLSAPGGMSANCPTGGSEVYVHPERLADDAFYYILGDDGRVRCVERAKVSRASFDQREQRGETLQVTKEDQERTKQILRTFLEEERVFREEIERNQGARYASGHSEAQDRFSSSPQASSRRRHQRERRHFENESVEPGNSSAVASDRRDASSSSFLRADFSLRESQSSPSRQASREQTLYARRAPVAEDLPPAGASARRAFLPSGACGLYSETTWPTRPHAYRTEAWQAESRPAEAFGRDDTQHALFSLSADSSRLVSAQSDNVRKDSEVFSGRREAEESGVGSEETSCAIQSLGAVEQLFPSTPASPERSVAARGAAPQSHSHAGDLSTGETFAFQDSQQMPQASSEETEASGGRRGDSNGSEGPQGKATQSKREGGQAGEVEQAEEVEEEEEKGGERERETPGMLNSVKPRREARDGGEQIAKTGNESRAPRHDSEASRETQKANGGEVNCGTRLKPLHASADESSGTACSEMAGVFLRGDNEERGGDVDVASLVDRLHSISEKGKQLFGEKKRTEEKEEGTRGEAPNEAGDTEEIAALVEVDLS
ncbi:hypothetical protein TGVAND_313480 [Toxoplasma gondii VAND]|uniref:Uncharacterized protein n=1 Tax=Toxoplasma gondii VAND TaxID=933077 RepID=A0A086QB57_TOXGO|nr:hypothetical protein TGVAND_313480 [Toxoplasma gondii VAND]